MATKISPKHKEAIKYLRIAKGSIDGIIKMIEEDRYCIEISTQLLAVISLLRKTHISVINKHIDTCIREAMISGDVDQKIKELQELFQYLEKAK